MGLIPTINKNTVNGLTPDIVNKASPPLPVLPGKVQSDRVYSGYQTQSPHLASEPKSKLCSNAPKHTKAARRWRAACLSLLVCSMRGGSHARSDWTTHAGAA